jgi:hypothetical protein
MTYLSGNLLRAALAGRAPWIKLLDLRRPRCGSACGNGESPSSRGGRFLVGVAVGVEVPLALIKAGLGGFGEDSGLLVARVADPCVTDDTVR